MRKKVSRRNGDNKRFHEEISDELMNMPESFFKPLEHHMRRKRLTNETIAEHSGLSSRIISDYRNKESLTKELPTVMTLCMGLNLHPFYAEDLIEKAGHVWKRTQEHMVYKWCYFITLMKIYINGIKDLKMQETLNVYQVINIDNLIPVAVLFLEYSYYNGLYCNIESNMKEYDFVCDNYFSSFFIREVRKWTKITSHLGML